MRSDLHAVHPNGQMAPVGFKDVAVKPLHAMAGMVWFNVGLKKLACIDDVILEIVTEKQSVTFRACLCHTTGTDTSSVTMSWIPLALQESPDLEEALLQEVQSLMAGRSMHAVLIENKYIMYLLGTVLGPLPKLAAFKLDR